MDINLTAGLNTNLLARPLFCRLHSVNNLLFNSLIYYNTIYSIQTDACVLNDSHHVL